MSKQLLPSEIQVWYVLPVIRKELAKALIEFEGCTQKQAAEILGITPAAVSQYLNDKRGSDFALTPAVISEIKHSAHNLKTQDSTMLEATMKLLHHKLMTTLVCDYHKDCDPSVPKNCDLCIKQGLLQ